MNLQSVQILSCIDLCMTTQKCYEVCEYSSPLEKYML